MQCFCVGNRAASSPELPVPPDCPSTSCSASSPVPSHASPPAAVPASRSSVVRSSPSICSLEPAQCVRLYSFA